MDGDDFSGTTDVPEVYEGDVIVDISNVDSLSNAVVKGNLTIIGTVSDTFSFSNLRVEGDLNLSVLDGDIFDFDGIKIMGEMIVD